MLLTGRRIFYVDDNTNNRVITQTILEHEDASVKCHTWGGGDMLDRMQQFGPIDAILLDLHLPKNLTGYDVFDTIRAVPELAHVPIVAVSALDPAVEIPKARAKGFAGFISKPIHLVHFPQQIASIIAGEHVWA